MTLVVFRTADTASILFVNKISCKKQKDVIPVIRPAPDVLWLEMLQTLRFYREGEACVTKGDIPYNMTDNQVIKGKAVQASMRNFTIPHGNTGYRVSPCRSRSHRFIESRSEPPCFPSVNLSHIRIE